MNTFLIIVTIIICIFLVLIVLIQNPKGGGLSSGFSASNNIMGVQRTGDFLEKGTWVLAVAVMVLSLLINISAPRDGEVNNSVSPIQEQIDKAPAPSVLPTRPADSTKN